MDILKSLTKEAVKNSVKGVLKDGATTFASCYYAGFIVTVGYAGLKAGGKAAMTMTQDCVSGAKKLVSKLNKTKPEASKENGENPDKKTQE